MNERAKITPSHLSRQAIVYLRQSSAAQVENNRESTERQYALATRAWELGWPEDRIIVIDEDLGLSGSGSVARSCRDLVPTSMPPAKLCGAEPFSPGFTVSGR